MFNAASEAFPVWYSSEENADGFDVSEYTKYRLLATLGLAIKDKPALYFFLYPVIDG